MIQKVNGVTVPTKAVHVPSFSEVEQAEADGESIQVMVATYDGNGTETVGFLELHEVKNLRKSTDGHYSFNGRISRLDMSATMHLDGVVCEIVSEVERGFARVMVDSLGECIAFSITMSVSIQLL